MLTFLIAWPIPEEMGECIFGRHYFSSDLSIFICGLESPTAPAVVAAPIRKPWVLKSSVSSTMYSSRECSDDPTSD